MRNKEDIKRANFDFSVRDVLNNRDKMLQEQKEAAAKKERDDLFSSVYATEGVYLYNKRRKAQLLERRMSYADHFMKVALNEALSYVVNNALLLDTEQYAKLNENYKNEINETVKAFVENNTVDSSFKNETILELFKVVEKDIPSADLYLSEEAEGQYIQDLILSTPKIKAGLDTMTRDVRARVANIVAKDQANLAKEADDLDYITQKELNAAPLEPVQSNPVDPGITPLADPEDPNNIPVNTVSTQPVSTQESFVVFRKSNNVGILEALTLNEAKDMIDNGKEFDKILALANSIKLITIFEALDESGVVKFGPNEYNRIVSASGKSLNPVAKTNLPGEQITKSPVANVPTASTESEETVTPTAKPIENIAPSVKDTKIQKEINELNSGIRNSGLDLFGDMIITPSKTSVFGPLAQWQKDHSTSGDVVDLPEDLHGKYTNHRGEVFTESQLRNFFEKEGYNLNLVDFESLYTSYNFVKH